MSTTNERLRTPADPQPATAADRRVRLLEPDDVRRASVVLARAFADEPSAVALLPDPTERRRLAVFKAEQVVRATLPHASVYGMEFRGELAGVAVWHPPNVTPRSAAATLRLLAGVTAFAPEFGRALAPALPRLWEDRQAALRIITQRSRAARASTPGPTWYLAVLGTDPRFQGRGVARALLDHILVRCDLDGVGAWLETTDPVNVPLYERFAFRTTAHLDGGAVVPDLWAMRREPQPLAAPDLTTD